MRSKTALYQLVYDIAGPLYPLMHLLVPSYVTTTVDLAHAMIEAAGRGCERQVLETADINRLAQQYKAT